MVSAVNISWIFCLQILADGFKIRRSAVEHSVGCVTAIDTAHAMLTVREQGRSEDLTPIDITTI